MTYFINDLESAPGAAVKRSAEKASSLITEQWRIQFGVHLRPGSHICLLIRILKSFKGIGQAIRTSRRRQRNSSSILKSEENFFQSLVLSRRWSDIINTMSLTSGSNGSVKKY